jgi:hypothetical protein
VSGPFNSSYAVRDHRVVQARQGLGARLVGVQPARFRRPADVEHDPHRIHLRVQQGLVVRRADLIRRPVVRPKRRKKTRPTKASTARRLESKRRRANVKRERSARDDE